jgi:hypothetical protein
VEHTYAQCKEVHAGDGHSGECSLLVIRCEFAKDITRLCLVEYAKMLRKTFYNAKRELEIGSILQVRA